MLAATIGEVLTTMAGVPSEPVQRSIAGTALPELAMALSKVRIDPYGPAVSSSIEFVDAIFQGLPSPMTPGLFERIAGQLFDVLTSTDDRQIVQSGLNVVTNVVRKNVEQLLQWYVSRI